MNIISAVVLIVFAVIGAAAIANEISLRLFRCDEECAMVYVTPINKECRNAELLVRNIASKLGAGRNRKNCYAVCLDCDMDDETKKVCEKLCREYGFIKLMNKEEFIANLK